MLNLLTNGSWLEFSTFCGTEEKNLMKIFNLQYSKFCTWYLLFYIYIKYILKFQGLLWIWLKLEDQLRGRKSHTLRSSSRLDERVRLLINNVIIGGPPKASHDQDRIMADVLNMHENKERLDTTWMPPHTLTHKYINLDMDMTPHGDNRCAVHIYKCLHTGQTIPSVYFHCRQTAEGRVMAAVTQQSSISVKEIQPLWKC